MEAGIDFVSLVTDAPASECSADTPADAQRIDFLFFTSGRHEGDRKAARQYLAWETALVAQLDSRWDEAWPTTGRGVIARFG